MSPNSITTVLVANRGEVASRIARTATRLGIRTVGVYAESDRNAAYLDDLDVAVALGDDATSSPYIDHELILEAARRTGADAIHPGYGFLAENAEFAAAVIEQGLIWVGPPPQAMAEMAGKIRAKEIARDSGVPVLDSVTVDADPEGSIERARAIPTPLLVKPSAGGGGKGMHRVDDHAELAQTIVTAQREAISSFGDGTLFIERYVESPRHVEVQVFADQHGNVVHLGDRDCSVQRRHQKIVEEAPAPGLDPRVRERMAEAAVSLTRSIGYEGAGTVEFLYFNGDFAFLEMNTRLQVEHPVTEEVTGEDLVEWQFVVASGGRLPRSQEEITLEGHSVEVRLYAEDPANDYLPSPGTVHLLEVPEEPQARWELGVCSGSPVSSRYDPMIAKIVVDGRDRLEAIDRLDLVLGRLRVHGVATNRDLLRAILADDDFRAGQLSTALLDTNPALAERAIDEEAESLHAVAAALHTALRLQANKTIQPFTGFGWRNVRSQPDVVEIEGLRDTHSVGLTRARDGRWVAEVSGTTLDIRVLADPGTRLVIQVDGLRQVFRVSEYGHEVVVDSARGSYRFTEKTPLEEAADAAEGGGAVTATVPGAVVAAPVSVGDRVEAGETLVVLEAMKMEHRYTAEEAGVVEKLLVAVGDTVDYQQLLVVVSGDAESEAAS
ncbi:biotin carboxylase N-terminal domain-containing protein [Dietzia kunjamensis]|uniref:ATP-binding protein n=1 Tax=Dietzia kunjamensis TaxID=322509 RepID=UPI0033696ADB